MAAFFGLQICFRLKSARLEDRNSLDLCLHYGISGSISVPLGLVTLVSLPEEAFTSLRNSPKEFGVLLILLGASPLLDYYNTIQFSFNASYSQLTHPQ